MERHEDSAVKWFRLATNGNERAPALANLGYMLATGKGMTQDWSGAVLQFREATNSIGVSQYSLWEAYANLALCLYSGQGVEKDEEAAVELFQHAAGWGDAQAQYNLGICCLLGQGTRKDHYKAYMWFHLAAEQNYPNAVACRDRAAKKMSPAQINEAQRRAALLRTQPTVFSPAKPKKWNDGLRLPDLELAPPHQK